MKIINLTMHNASPEQIEAGVIEPCELSKKTIKAILNFDEIPSHHQLTVQAETLAMYATGFATHAMIGGAPFFMEPLAKALKAFGVTPVYAFSVRESIEKVLEDGSTTKTSVFKHKGFVGL